jgi:hypothetical protein
MSQNFCTRRPLPGEEIMLKKMEDRHEWECPECGQVGNYADIRRYTNSGVDCCPNCKSPVECVDE